MLPRSLRTIKTKYGPIRIKEVKLEGRILKYKAEYEDCARAAKDANVSLQEIYRAVNQIMDQKNK
jgi:uncharacterized protein (DUF111 family)